MALDAMTVEEAKADAEELCAGVLQEVFVEQVEQVYPAGATLCCDRCGESLALGPRQLASFFHVAWPRHCSQQMRIGDGGLGAGGGSRKSLATGH